MRLLLALLLLDPAAALAQNMRILAGDDSAEVKEAAQELRELERRIKRKDIPPISFELNKAVLKPEAKAALDFVADVMFKHPDLKLMVFGHTCDLGSDEYNLWLSQKRAEAVKDYLVSLGVGADRILTVSKGKEQPFCQDMNEACYQQNRRGHFIITGK